MPPQCASTTTVLDPIHFTDVDEYDDCDDDCDSLSLASSSGASSSQDSCVSSLHDDDDDDDDDCSTSSKDEISLTETEASDDDDDDDCCSTSRMSSRRVCFADEEDDSLCRIRMIDNHADWDDATKAAYWYNKSEYNKMRKHMANMLKRFNHKRKQQETFDEVRHTADGLEMYSLTRRGRARVLRRNAARKQVVRHQYRKKMIKGKKKVAAVDLSKVSLRGSHQCRAAAVERAAASALFVLHDNPEYYAGRQFDTTTVISFVTTTTTTQDVLWLPPMDSDASSTMSILSSTSSSSSPSSKRKQQEESLDWLQQPLHQFCGKLLLGLP